MNKFEDARMNKFEDARSTGQKEVNIMGKYEQDARLLLEYVRTLRQYPTAYRVCDLSSTIPPRRTLPRSRH